MVEGFLSGILRDEMSRSLGRGEDSVSTTLSARLSTPRGQHQVPTWPAEAADPPCWLSPSRAMHRHLGPALNAKLRS